MDLQAAETAHIKDKKEPIKSAWACPCNGCAKAVKQERNRITELINNIDINSPSQLNALGMKLIILDIVNAESASRKEKKKNV